MYRTTAAKRKSSKKSLSVPTQIFEPQQCPAYSFFTATLRHFYGAFMTRAASPSIFLVAGRSGAAGSWSMGQYEVTQNMKGTHDGKPRGALALFRCHGRAPSLGSKMQGVYQNVIASLRDFYGTFTTSLALYVILSSVKASE